MKDINKKLGGGRRPAGIGRRLLALVPERHRILAASASAMGIFFLGVYLLLGPGGVFRADAAAALVQTATGSAKSATAASATFGVATTPGNLLIAVVGTRDAVAINPISGWATAINENGAGFPSQAIFYRRADGTETTVTGTTGAVSGSVGVHIYEYSGVDGVLDQTSSATSAGNTPTAGTVTTDEADQLLFAAYADDINTVHNDASWSDVEGFTERNDFKTTGAGTNATYAGGDNVANVPGTFVVSTNTGAATNARGQFISFTVADPDFGQSAYRIFEGADSTDVGSPLAAQDTAAALPADGATFRLRQLVHVSNEDLPLNSQKFFKLQYAAQSGTCDTAFTGETYADVTAATPIAFYDNVTPVDGASLTPNASDPTHGADVVHGQTYEELNDFTNAVAAIPAGNDGLWDFSLVDNTAPDFTTYCFRVVKSDGTLLDSYSVIPEITTGTVPVVEYEQSAYRLFANQDSTDVGAPLAAQDTPHLLSSAGDAFRLRQLLHVSGQNLGVGGESFKLQYAQRSGVCDTAFSGETYADVTAGTPLAYFDNATPADGVALTPNANDPTHGGDTVVDQTYEELNNFSNSSAVNVGEDGLWDFSLFDNGSPAATSYCLRAVKSDGSLLDTYSVVPEITTASPIFEQSAYRFFENADSTDVGAPLAAQNSGVALASSGDAFRLRQLIHVSNIGLGIGAQSFKLQYAARSGACDTAFAGETYADVTAGTPIAYNDNPTPADGAALTGNANDPTHGADAVIDQTYEELNDFTSTSVIAIGEDGMWDFSLVDNSAPEHVHYCLRVVKADGSLLDTYSVVPEVTTAAASFEQSAYRFFSNADSTDVGSALEAQDTPASLDADGDAFRLRQLIHVAGNELPSSGHSFTLQYALRSGTCDAAFVGETYADVTAATPVAYLNNPTPIDGDPLTGNAGDPTDGGHVTVNQTYEELNNFTNSVAAIPAGQDGMWDFSLIDNDGVSTATYCLRVIDFADNPLGGYAVIPEISFTDVIPNDAPTGLFNAASQKTDGTGLVDVSIEADDADADDTRARVEYETDSDGACDGPWAGATLVGPAAADVNDAGGAPDVNNANAYQVGSGATTRIITSSGSNTVDFDWDSASDLPTADGTQCLRLTVNDDTEDQATPDTFSLSVDNVDPTGLANLAAGAATTSTQVLTWDVAADTNFNHYEIWYGTNAADVDNRTGTALEWDDADDPTLSLATTAATTIGGLSSSTTFFYKIFAIDDDGNELTIPAISAATNAAPPPSGGGGGGGGGYVCPEPTAHSVRINQGDAVTSSRDVSVYLEYENVTHVILSENYNFEGGIERTVASVLPFELSEGAGTKTVYARLRNNCVSGYRASDSIVLDPDFEGVPPKEEPEPEPEPEPVPPTDDTGACTLDCARSGIVLYIVNPDGTERFMGTAYAREEDVGGGVRLIHFEDKGDDMDLNDVTLALAEASCGRFLVGVIGVDARWHHRIRARLTYDGIQHADLSLWPDSHEAVGFEAIVNVRRYPHICLADALDLGKAHLPEAGVPARPEEGAEEQPEAPIIAIDPSLCSVSQPFVSFLTIGTQSTEVRRLQELLQCLGHFPTSQPSTAIFGPLTATAVSAFQSSVGIDSVGYVGPATRAALNVHVK